MLRKMGKHCRQVEKNSFGSRFSRGFSCDTMKLLFGQAALLEPFIHLVDCGCFAHAKG
jgi:hypothetical protein